MDSKIYLYYNDNNAKHVKLLARQLKGSKYQKLGVVVKKYPIPEIGCGGPGVNFQEWANNFYDFVVEHDTEVKFLINVLKYYLGPLVLSKLSNKQEIGITTKVIHLDIDVFDEQNSRVFRNSFYYTSEMNEKKFVDAWNKMLAFASKTRTIRIPKKKYEYNCVESIYWTYQSLPGFWRRTNYKWFDKFIPIKLK